MFGTEFSNPLDDKFCKGGNIESQIYCLEPKEKRVDMNKLKNLFKGKSRSEIVSTIIYVALIIVMVICLIIKVWVVVEFADVPLSDIPAWALPWLGVTG